MIYNVTFANKATFIRNVKEAKITHVDKDGDVVSTSDYRQTFMPGVGRYYTPRVRNGRVMIDMAQDKLNELVEAMELYDGNNNQIKTAPIHNPAAPFWNHPKTKLYIEYSGINLDDEDPVGAFWLAVFRADPFFVTDKSALDNPALDGITKFKVVRTVDAISEQDKEKDEVVKATELLGTMDFDTKKRILRAMGVDHNNPSPEQVNRYLADRVIINKDKVTTSGERNIELFLRLASTKSEEINIRGVIARAMSLDKRVLLKKRGMYYYGEIPLGRSIDDVYQFLTREENKDLLTDISVRVGADSNNELS